MTEVVSYPSFSASFSVSPVLEMFKSLYLKTDEPIIFYDGTFIEVTDFLNKFYEDGRVDVESYENWTSRKESING